MVATAEGMPPAEGMQSAGDICRGVRCLPEACCCPTRGYFISELDTRVASRMSPRSPKDSVTLGLERLTAFWVTSVAAALLYLQWLKRVFP